MANSDWANYAKAAVRLQNDSQYNDRLAQVELDNQNTYRDRMMTQEHEVDADSAENWRLLGGDSTEVFHDLTPQYNLDTGEGLDVERDSGNARSKVYKQYALLHDVGMEQAILDVDRQSEAYKISKENGYDLGKQLADARSSGSMDENYTPTVLDIYRQGDTQLAWARKDKLANPETAYDESWKFGTGEKGEFGRELVDNKEYVGRSIAAGVMTPGSNDTKLLRLQRNAQDKARRLGIGSYSTPTGAKIMDAVNETSYSTWKENNVGDRRLTSRAANMAKLVPAVFVKAGIGLADSAVEMAGKVVGDTARLFDATSTIGDDWDLATGEEKREGVYSTMGVDSTVMDANAERVHRIMESLASTEIQDKGFMDNAVIGIADATKNVPVLNIITGAIDTLNRIGSNMTGKELKDVLATSLSNPETTVESLGDIAIMVLGGKGAGLTKLGSKISTVNKSKVLSDATKIKNTAKLKARASTSDRLKYTIAENAGVLAMSANITNDGLDEFEKENGRPADMTEVLGYYAGNTALLGLDKVVAVGIIKDTKTALNKAMDLVPDVPDVLAAQIVAKVGKVATDLGYAGVKELFQEIPQEAWEATGKYNFMGEGSLEGEAKDKAITDVGVSGATGGAMGLAGGVHMASAGKVVSLPSLIGKKDRDEKQAKSEQTIATGKAAVAFANEATSAPSTESFKTAVKNIKEVMEDSELSFDEDMTYNAMLKSVPDDVADRLKVELHNDPNSTYDIGNAQKAELRRVKEEAEAVLDVASKVELDEIADGVEAPSRVSPEVIEVLTKLKNEADLIKDFKSDGLKGSEEFKDISDDATEISELMTAYMKGKSIDDVSNEFRSLGNVSYKDGKKVSNSKKGLTVWEKNIAEALADPKRKNNLNSKAGKTSRALHLSGLSTFMASRREKMYPKYGNVTQSPSLLATVESENTEAVGSINRLIEQTEAADLTNEIKEGYLELFNTMKSDLELSTTDSKTRQKLLAEVQEGNPGVNGIQYEVIKGSGEHRIVQWTGKDKNNKDITVPLYEVTEDGKLEKVGESSKANVKTTETVSKVEVDKPEVEESPTVTEKPTKAVEEVAPTEIPNVKTATALVDSAIKDGLTLAEIEITIDTQVGMSDADKEATYSYAEEALAKVVPTVKKELKPKQDDVTIPDKETLKERVRELASEHLVSTNSKIKVALRNSIKNAIKAKYDTGKVQIPDILAEVLKGCK